MGSFWLPLVVVAAATLAVVALVVLVVLRRLVLARVAASFDCAVRLRSGPHGWSAGVARYGPDRIDWFPVFSLWPWPSRTFQRRRLTLVCNQPPHDGALVTAQPGVRVVACRYDGLDLDLAMTVDAFTGLSSWLEASPPGPVSRVT